MNLLTKKGTKIGSFFYVSYYRNYFKIIFETTLFTLTI